ncbi:hypothetical protein [Amycolatopsis taiwanensis]|uniref:hypothetical protein n=1 Tax=Amycolatopsis taiwanensis TaxID=342230 RepID=UPI00048511C6|nr:hypothetical protein [Amycolatopsis taiwanensis]
MTTTFVTVTGSRWVRGVEETVTGFPIRQGLTTSAIAFVTLLTESGAVVSDVQVNPAVLDGVRVKPLFNRTRDEFLWKIADSGAFGAGTRALAELTMRARRDEEQAEQERSYRIERSRRDAARLVAV